MNRVVFILLFLIGPLVHLAGQPQIDSMIRALDQSLEDTTRLRLLGEISNYFRTRDYDTAVHYLEQYVSLAEVKRDRGAQAEAYYFLGGPLAHLGSVNSAIEYLNKALHVYEDLGDSSGMAMVYNGFGRIYLDEGDYKEALEHFNKSKEIYEFLGEERYLPHLLLNIGISYDALGQHDFARSYHLRALHMLTQSGDTSRVMISALLNLGENYELTNDLDKTYNYYIQALAMSKRLNILIRIVDCYHHISRYYNICGQYELAKNYLDSAWAISTEQNLLISMRDQSLLYSEIFENMGDFQAALLYAQKYNQIYDQLRQQEINKKLERMRFDREMNRVMRENAIALHRVKLTRNFAAIGLILLFITLAVMYRNFRIKKKANAILAELDELKSRMFSNISHELRTPLTLILDPIEQMMETEQKHRPTAP